MASDVADGAPPEEINYGNNYREPPALGSTRATESNGPGTPMAEEDIPF
jgi:hypothetical protein